MLYGDKRFLNEDPRETGAIAFCVESPPAGSTKKKYSEVDASVHIQDCNNKVYIDLSYKTESGLQKRIAKIDLMVEVLLEGKQAILDAYGEFSQLIEETDEEKENRIGKNPTIILEK